MTLNFQFLLNQIAASKKLLLLAITHTKKLFLPIFCIVHEVWWFSFGSMTQPINCGKASWLSMTRIRYSAQAEMKKSALTASWHCWIQSNEICWPCNDFPERAQLSLPSNPKEKNARRRSRKQKCVCKYQCTASRKWTCSRLIVAQHISCFKIPGSITQPYSPQCSHEEWGASAYFTRSTSCIIKELPSQGITVPLDHADSPLCGCYRPKVFQATF